MKKKPEDADPIGSFVKELQALSDVLSDMSTDVDWTLLALKMQAARKACGDWSGSSSQLLAKKTLVKHMPHAAAFKAAQSSATKALKGVTAKDRAAVLEHTREMIADLS